MSVSFKRLGSFGICLATLLILSIGFAAFTYAPAKGFYQLKVYHLKNKEQEAQLDQYLKEAYLPALHRAGISKVGVFKPVEKAEGDAAEQLVYVFVPYKAPEQFFKLDETLAKDKQYAAAAKEYMDASHENPPYVRFENILMEAFEGMPGIKAPDLKTAPAERIYEMRSYEAATEKLHQNKVAMFNSGEIEIFDRLGFNAVFYGRVLAGTKMPNLIYMTTFENMEERDKHWDAFGVDPAWKKLSGDPQYANNFLRADIYLLRPTEYSDI